MLEFEGIGSYSVFIAIALTTALVAYWILQPIATRKIDGKHIPQVPGGLPFLGHALTMSKDSSKFFAECKEKYGLPFSFYAAGRNYVIVGQELKSEYFSAKEDALSFMQVQLDILVPKLTIGERPLKKPIGVRVIKEQMSPIAVEQFSKHLGNSIQTYFRKYFPAEVLNGTQKEFAMEDAEKFAWMCIAHCSATAFCGPKLAASQDLLDVFLHFHSSSDKVIQMNMIAPLLVGLVSGDVKRDKAIIKAHIVPEIHHRMANGFPSEPDMLTHILQTRSDYDVNDAEDMELLVELMLGMIFGSMVTTAGQCFHLIVDLAAYGNTKIRKTADASLYAFANGRDGDSATLLDLMHAECQGALAKAGGVLTKEAMEDMKLLESFIRESTRFAFSAFNNIRVAIKDTTIGGYAVPNKSLVAISGYLANRDPAFFTNPEEFNPLRFITCGSDPASTFDAGLFIFGNGARVCKGRYFAISELKAVVCNLLERFTFESAKTPAYSYTMTQPLREKVPIVFKQRISSVAAVKVASS